MASFNRVILMGNLTRDIELRYTTSGMAVGESSVAVNDRRKNQSGEWVDEATFVEVKFFGRTAEIAGEYLSKGSPIHIEGKLKLDTAVEEGIVAGGGVALLRAKQMAGAIKGDNADQDAGIKLVLKAIEAPLREIVYNAGGEASVVVAAVLAGKGNYGFNAANDTYGDMIEMGILDPTKVTRTALQNAASVASLMLTTECMVSESPKADAPAMGGGGDMGGMGGMGGMGM